MRTVLVVVAAPVGDHDLCFEQAVEFLDGETLIAQSRVERSGPGVLPGRAGVDGVRARSGRLAPVDECVRGQFRTVVAADELGCSPTVDHGLFERRHGRVRIDRSVHDDGEGLAGELIDDVEQLDRAASSSNVELEVECPDLIRCGCGAPLGRDRYLTETATFPMFLGHTEALLAPQTVDLLDVAHVTGLGGLDVRPPVAPTRTSRRELP